MDGHADQVGGGDYTSSTHEVLASTNTSDETIPKW